MWKTIRPRFPDKCTSPAPARWVPPTAEMISRPGVSVKFGPTHAKIRLQDSYTSVSVRWLLQDWATGQQRSTQQQPPWGLAAFLSVLEATKRLQLSPLTRVLNTWLDSLECKSGSNFYKIVNNSLLSRWGLNFRLVLVLVYKSLQTVPFFSNYPCHHVYEAIFPRKGL